MSAKWLAGTCLLLVVAFGGPDPSAQSSAAPRTPWGHPDIQGVWDYWTFTPLERPAEFKDRAVITTKEAADFAQRQTRRALDEAPTPGQTGAYNQDIWTDRIKSTALTQTSLIVDPPDGKIPPLTPEGLKRAEAHRAAGGYPVRIRTGGAGSDNPEDRGVAERCLLGFSTGPPMLPAGYNNNVQIIQTPDHVVLLLEMNHDARIVPIDGRPPLPSHLRQWLGNSRGHWEGDTLVVETTNFTDKTASISLTGFAVGAADTLRLVERFTRTGAGTLRYEFTVHDPATFTRPFTGRSSLNFTNERIYEFACHEGNYAMIQMLRGARTEERGAAVPR